MDNQENPVEVGTHSPSLSTPILQMGALLHPLEIEHRARAVDVTTAISTMHAEIAQSRAEITVLRMALITEIEHVVQLRQQAERLLTTTQHAVDSLHEDFKRFSTQMLNSQDDLGSRVVEQLGLDTHAIQQALDHVHVSIDRIPSTYYWARLKSWLYKLFGRSHGF